MIGVFLRSVGKFASGLYLAGLAVIMLRAPVTITPDALFKYEFALVVGLAVFQAGLFGKEILGIVRK